tara:strand:+ start:313 stop:600 length:288 start_codon:yes stop_codon:yes gene_type:complete
MAMLNCLPLSKDYIQNKSLILGSGFRNPGYFGIQVSSALRPNHSLAYSMEFDIGATFVIWVVGPMMFSYSPKGLIRPRDWSTIVKQYFLVQLLKD